MLHDNPTVTLKNNSDRTFVLTCRHAKALGPVTSLLAPRESVGVYMDDAKSFSIEPLGPENAHAA